MKSYKIGLELAGNVFFILEIFANTLQIAVEEWARVTGHDDALFDKKNHTYFSWKIVQTKLPPLQRKENLNPFNH